jgi:hypothetical protein
MQLKTGRNGVIALNFPISWPESGVVALIFIVRRWGEMICKNSFQFSAFSF